MLLNSEALEYETGRIPDEQRRTEVAAVLASTNEYLGITDQVEALAISMEDHGIASMDAVHLALASTAKADLFVTCDDRLLYKAKAVTGLGCRVISVLGAVSEVFR